MLAEPAHEGPPFLQRIFTEPCQGPQTTVWEMLPEVIEALK